MLEIRCGGRNGASQREGISASAPIANCPERRLKGR